MNIVLDNNSTNNLDLDFTDLSNVSSEPLKIEVNKANDFNEVKNFSNNRPSLTMSSKNVNIGLDLLANPNKVKSDPNKSPSLTNMKSSNNIVIDKIQEVKLDNIKEVSLDSVNLDKEINLNSEVKLSGDLSSNNDVKQFDFSSLPTPQPEPIKLTPAETEEARRKKYEEIQKEKFELLCLFERLEKKKYSHNKKIYNEFRY